jgi:hypothetical protein
MDTSFTESDTLNESQIIQHGKNQEVEKSLEVEDADDWSNSIQNGYEVTPL